MYTGFRLTISMVYVLFLKRERYIFCVSLQYIHFTMVEFVFGGGGGGGMVW